MPQTQTVLHTPYDLYNPARPCNHSRFICSPIPLPFGLCETWWCKNTTNVGVCTYSSSAYPSVAAFSVSVSHPHSEGLLSGLIKLTITFFDMRDFFLLRFVFRHAMRWCQANDHARPFFQSQSLRDATEVNCLAQGLFPLYIFGRQLGGDVGKR